MLHFKKMREGSKVLKKLVQIFPSVGIYMCKTWILWITLVYIQLPGTGQQPAPHHAATKCYSQEDLLPAISRRLLPVLCPDTSKLRSCEGVPTCFCSCYQRKNPNPTSCLDVFSSLAEQRCCGYMLQILWMDDPNPFL